MKKFLTTTIAAIALLCCVFALCACTSDEIESGSGAADDGREYGQIYDIDDYATGSYLVPYEVISDSTMGKAMVRKFCVANVKVVKSADGITLTLYVTDSSQMSDPRLVGADGQDISSKSVQGYGYDGYEFEVTRDMLDSEISVKMYINMMKRDTNFGISLDLTQAELTE